MIRRFTAIGLFGCLLLGGRAEAAAPQQHWLVVSDVHFDPFSDSRIVGRLVAAPAERWRSVFASAGPMPFSNYGSDTNYPLLESALEGMRNELAAPDVTIVSGDFLAHDFRKKFQAATKLQDERSYDTFVDKTMTFLANEFVTAFPHSKFLPAIGNNDSYCGDYASEPNSPFLMHMAQVWSAGVGAPDGSSWRTQFSAGGYYTVPLPLANARAVVVNDVFWSQKYTNACGDKTSDPGGDEMNWLRSTLDGTGPRTPAWVIGHIPPGVDVFSTLSNGAGTNGVTMMLAERFNDGLIGAIDDAQDVVMAIAGHTHMNSFRVIGPNPSRAVTPMFVVPAVSPVYSNNPAFTTLDIDGSSAAVTDSRTFVLEDLSALAKDGRRPAKWRREYDFGSVFGHGTIDAPRLEDVEQTMFRDDRVRMRFEQYYDSESGRVPITDPVWRAYWCGNIALTPTAYTACAMPQIQRSMPPQPTPPPTAVPSPSPSPAASPSPKATALP